MVILSPKNVLLNQLHWLLSSEQGSYIESFTEILHGPRALTDASSQVNSTRHFNKDINWQEIPLTKTQDICSVLYTSALPQKLAKQYDLKRSLTLTEISQRIVHWLNQARQKQFDDLCDLAYKDFDSSLPHQLWFEFEIGTQRLGRIAFCLSNRGVALWLQHVQQDLHGLHEDSHWGESQKLSLSRIDTSLLWQMQYTHARCCTLLALWQTSQPDQSIDHRSLRPTDTYPLGLSAPQAQRLIQALIETADDMFWIPYRWPDRQYVLLLKRATQLCQSFDQFYRGCLYGFGQLSSTAAPSEMSRFKANFGLVAATRNLLKVLLYKHFHAKSPASL